MKNSHLLREGLINYVLVLIAVLLTVYLLVVARGFLYPIVIATLLGYLLYPVVNFLEKKRVPRVFAIFITIVFFLLVLVGIGWFVVEQIQVIMRDIPALKKQAIENMNYISSMLTSITPYTESDLKSFLREGIVAFFRLGNEVFNTFLSSTTTAIIKLGLMPVYIFLFLYYRTKFANFLLKIIPREKKMILLRVLREIATLMPRYMFGITIVVMILMVINSLGLYLIGVEYPVTFGILSAICNFIPYFGTLLGGLIPLLFTLIAGAVPIDPIKVIILYFIIQFIENNILTPNIVGHNVNVSPLFIILGLIAAAIVWGLPGMLVIVPILAAFHIICKNVERFEPLAYLLGPKGTRRYTLNFRNIKEWGKSIAGKISKSFR